MISYRSPHEGLPQMTLLYSVANAEAHTACRWSYFTLHHVSVRYFYKIFAAPPFLQSKLYGFFFCQIPNKEKLECTIKPSILLLEENISVHAESDKVGTAVHYACSAVQTLCTVIAAACRGQWLYFKSCDFSWYFNNNIILSVCVKYS